MENNRNISAFAGDYSLFASIGHNPRHFCSTFCSRSWNNTGIVFIFSAIFYKLAYCPYVVLDGSGKFTCTFSMDGRRIFWGTMVAAFFLSFHCSANCLMDTVLHLVFCADSTHDRNDVYTGRANVCLARAGVVFCALFSRSGDVEESDTKVLGGWRVDDKIFKVIYRDV